MTCSDCKEPVREGLTQCPHCGRPSWFPNVNAAQSDSERLALEARYNSAVQDAAARGADAPRAALETVASGAVAVCSRYFGEVYRLAYSEDEVYATFYQRLAAGTRIPGGDRWEGLRSAADTVLFGELQKREVRFAALTVNDSGLTNYGDWMLFPKEDMIAHRSTVFEENSVLFFRKHDIRAGNDYAVPQGYRAPWEMRHRLVAAKLAPSLNSATDATEFASLLLKSGVDSANDEFVEVHIWGGLTIRSFVKVSGRFCKELPSPHEQKVLEEKLNQVNVALEMP